MPSIKTLKTATTKAKHLLRVFVGDRDRLYVAAVSNLFHLRLIRECVYTLARVGRRRKLTPSLRCCTTDSLARAQSSHRPAIKPAFLSFF